MAATDETLQHIRTAEYRRRFYSKLLDDTNGCHVWTGAVSSNGRGMIGALRQTYSVHRIAWMIQHGRLIPDGLTVDHLCYNGLCVNPDHLEVVEHAVNQQRAIEHFGLGCSLRVREGRNGEMAYQVLWIERNGEGTKKQRGRTFKTRELAAEFMDLIRDNRTVA
jgi:hypothetical protein